MPTYEYECKDCKSVIEVFQNINDEKLTDCPECETGKVYRLISGGAGVIFKGSGFYVNDSKKSETAPCGKKVDKAKKDNSCTKCEAK